MAWWLIQNGILQITKTLTSQKLVPLVDYHLYSQWPMIFKKTFLLVYNKKSLSVTNVYIMAWNIVKEVF